MMRATVPGVQRLLGVGGLVAWCSLSSVGCGLFTEAPNDDDLARKAANANKPDREDSTPSRLHLASWNIEWLHDQGGQGPVQRTEADYDRLREYARQLDADVIALQEIRGPEAARRVFDEERYEFHFSGRRNAQLVGFAFKRQLEVEPHPDLVELSLGESVRRGVDIRVQVAGRPLRLLAVHLKSGCFSESLDSSNTNCQKLSAQLPLVEKWIDERALQGEAFAVLGDFNRRLRHDEAFYVELDDQQPANADLTLVTDGRSSDCWSGKYPEFIDHILLGKQAAAWLRPNSFEQLVFAAQDDDGTAPDFELSDHCPISVVLAPN